MQLNTSRDIEYRFERESTDSALFTAVAGSDFSHFLIVTFGTTQSPFEGGEMPSHEPSTWRSSMESNRFVDAKARCVFRCAAAAAFLVGVGVLGACQAQQQRVSEHEDNLAAAGFVFRPANTPERQAMLARLPPHRFVQRVKGDAVTYIYADPLVCGCLYVGSQQAYGNYKQHEQQQHLADEQQMTAQTYSDAAWNWNAWGPWGPGYAFGYGPGIGW